MTANQIAYWKYQEDQRHNAVMEAETERANKEKEAISRQEIGSKESIERAKNMTKRAEIEGKYGPTYAAQYSDNDPYIDRQNYVTGNSALHAIMHEVGDIVNPIAGFLKSLF